MRSILMMMLILNFNPRSPHGERPAPCMAAVKWQEISIHAPRTGSDAFVANGYGKGAISIHAPRTGSDVDWWTLID